MLLIKNPRSIPARRPLAHSLSRFTSALACCAALVAGTGSTGAGTFYWDSDATAAGNNVNGAGLGGTGTWSPGTFWWDGVSADVPWPNTSSDIAVFAGTSGTVTLGLGGVTANGLSFFTNGYTVSGGTLTLAGTTPGVSVNLGELVTISSQIAGTQGFAMSGRGAVRLTNALNSFTGETSINSGSVIINNAGALGASTATIEITGSAARGAAGGQLVLEGAYNTPGVNITRDIQVQGLGPISDRSGALNSVHNNTLSGKITTGILFNATAQNTAFNSASGRLTLSNELNVGGTAGTTFTTFGLVNTVGVGSYEINGTLSGTGSLQKTGSGTLILNPTDATGFGGRFRISAGTVRINSVAALGTGTAGGINAVLDMNGGTLEVRADSGAIDRNVYHRAGGGALFADHAVNSSAINGTTSFGNLTFEENLTTTFNSRNGYGMSFDAATVNGGDNNSTFTNNLNGGGVLNFAGNLWSNNNGTVRTFTMGGNADTFLTGNIVAPGTGTGAHVVTKAGTGTWTILTTGTTGSTFRGAVNINAGTLAISDFRAINDNTANIVLGATGALRVVGNNVAPANLATSKVVVSAGTTGNALILADQTGTSGRVIFNAAFTATGTGARALNLGGSNAENNTINGAISNPPSGALSLNKIGSGTWVLGGVNTYSGATTISNGTLKLQDTFSGTSRNLLTGTIGFGVNTFEQAAGGTLEYIGAAGSDSAETVGQLIQQAGAGTVRVASGSAGTATLTFASLGARTAGMTLDLRPDANSSIRFTTAPAGTNGILGGHATFNGVDWVATGTAAAQFTAYTFGLPPSLATGTANYLSNASVTTTAAQTVNSLKVAGAQTITLGDVLTLTSGGILFDNSTGAATITGSQLGASGSEVIVTVNGSVPGNALTIDSAISGAAGQFTKAGNGTVILSGANAFSGNAHINAGTVRMSGATAQLGAAQTAATVLNIRQGAVLDLNGAGAAVVLYPGGPSVAGIQTGTLVGPGTITNSGGGSGAESVLVIGNGTTTAAGGLFTGLLQDGGGRLNIVKAGTGGQSLTRLNTYTGATVINSGTLAVTALASIGTASSIGAGNPASNAASLVFNGGTLLYTGATATIFKQEATPSVSIDRLFTLAGNGTIDSQGSFGNSTLVRANNNAALIFNNSGPVAFSGTGARTLTLQGDSNGGNQINLRLINNPNAGEALSITKAGAGVWSLANTSNSYTGLTTVTAGQLGATSGTTLPANSPLVLNGGQILTSGNFVRNLVAAATPGNADEVTWSSAGGFAASDAGKLVVAIGGIVAPTALTWGSGGFLATGTGALILNSATALNEVEVRNPIVLNGALRTIQIDDNGNTFTDFATITGVISGTGTASGVSKTGGGQLQLFGANTYGGTTAVTNGQLVVNSLGNTTSPGPSSVGDSTTANTNASALTLGNAGTTAGILQYVGQGETSDRKIRLNTTTGNTQIHADGSGPLILTNVANDMVTGTGTVARTLSLRGSNTQANTITSTLADNGTVLNVAIDGGATWVLSGNNTFTGALTVGAGAFGIGSALAVGTGGSLNLSNGSTFAYGADRTVLSTVNGVSGTTSAVIGDYNLTFANPLQLPAGGNFVLTNNIVQGKALTLSGANVTGLTGARTWTINGAGNTFLSAPITSTGTGNNVLNVTYSGTGTLTLTGQSDYRGNTTIQNGRVIAAGAGDNRLPTGSPLIATGGTPGVLQLGNTAGPSNQTFTALASGTGSIVGGNGTVSTLTLSPTASGNFDLTLGGAGTNENNLKLVKTGSGTLTLNAVNLHTGGTQVGTPNGPDVGRLLVGFTGSVGSQITPSPVTVHGGTLEISGINQRISSLTLGGGNSTSRAILISDADLEINGNITYDATTNPKPGRIGGLGSVVMNSPVATTVTVGKSTGGSGSLQKAPDLSIDTAVFDNGSSGQDMIKEGLGTMRVSGSMAGFDGNVFVNRGTLIIDNEPSSSALPGTASVTVGTASNGAKFDLGGISGDRTDLDQLTLHLNSRLGFSLGGVDYDSLVVNDLLTPGWTAGSKTLRVDINALPDFGAGTYDLLGVSDPSLLDTFNPFMLGEVPGGFTYALNVDTTFGALLELVVNALPTDFLWKGGTSSNWSSGSNPLTGGGGSTNWVDVSGTVMPNGPGIETNVFFSASSPARQAITTVDVDTSVKSLTISDPVVNSIRGLGTMLTIANGLTIAPSANAVTLGSNTPGQELGIGIRNSQTWTNNSAGTLSVLNPILSTALSGVQTLTFAGSGSTSVSGQITDGLFGSQIAVKKESAGTATLAGAGSDYTGPTTVTAGTLAVSGSLTGTSGVEISRGATFLLQGTGDRVRNAATVAMGGGAGTVPATLVMNAVSEQMGTFTLSGNSVIDFGGSNASAELRLANSRAIVWDTGSTLTIYNWNGNPTFGDGADQLFFGANDQGLNSSQLATILFYSDSGSTRYLFNGMNAEATITSVGEVVPVPEPGAYGSLLGGIGLLLSLRRRRR